MANTRKSNSDLEERVDDTLRQLVPPDRSILLGLSGGMDSVLLLHLLHGLAPRYGWHLSALHVHHGISPNADAWAAFCTTLCARYNIPLHIEYVDIGTLREELGIEAAARVLRHAAFLKRGCDFVALAHHADDQAETLLLQLLRGTGTRGAAAMPVLSPPKRPLIKPADTHRHATLRPLLDIPRASLLEYARQHFLQWVEDESNSDDRYARNFVRHQIFPQLEKRFPAYRDTLSRSTRHFAEANGLLDELAQQDAGDWTHASPLAVEALHRLSPARAKNLLRYFLHTCGVPMPHEGQLTDLLSQLLEARANAAIEVNLGDWQVRRYRGRVFVAPHMTPFDPTLVLSWQGEAELYWPATASLLSFRSSVGQGIIQVKLQHAPVTLRLRNGGESLRPHPKSATRSLKNLLQEHHVPPWQRERLPLLYCGDELVCVVGVAVAADFQAGGAEPGIVVT